MSAKILIVEDEALVAFEIASALKKEGYSIIGTATNEQEAFRAIENEIPDLVMMDINIDGAVTGIEVARKIKALYSIPVIFLTAYSDKNTINEAIGTSPAAYLIKPFKREELYAAVSLATANSISSCGNIISISKLCSYRPDVSALMKEDVAVSLSKKEKQLLDLLITYGHL